MQRITVEYLKNNVVSKSGRSFKCYCPDCGGNDLYWTPYNGIAHCFNHSETYFCGDNETDGYELAVEEKPKDVERIRAYYAEMSSFYQDCLAPAHKEYLRARGITDEYIDTFKVGYCPASALPRYKEEIAYYSGIADIRGNPALPDRYTFSYIAEERVCDIRGRAASGQSPKYKSLYGSSQPKGSVYPFNWDNALALARQKGYMLVTEGEIKAAVAHIHGFPCVGLPGMTAWRDGFIKEPDWDVIVVFDSMRDRRSQWHVDRAIAKIGEHIPTYSVVSLPLLGEDKMDLDSYLLREGNAQRLEYLVRNALPATEYQRLRAF